MGGVCFKKELNDFEVYDEEVVNGNFGLEGYRVSSCVGFGVVGVVLLFIICCIDY